MDSPGPRQKSAVGQSCGGGNWSGLFDRGVISLVLADTAMMRERGMSSSMC
jgi:hypothetical protein